MYASGRIVSPPLQRKAELCIHLTFEYMFCLSVQMRWTCISCIICFSALQWNAWGASQRFLQSDYINPWRWVFVLSFLFFSFFSSCTSLKMQCRVQENTILEFLIITGSEFHSNHELIFFLKRFRLSFNYF